MRIIQENRDDYKQSKRPIEVQQQLKENFQLREYLMKSKSFVNSSWDMDFIDFHNCQSNIGKFLLIHVVELLL